VDCFPTSGIVVTPPYAVGPPPEPSSCGNGSTDCAAIYLGAADDELPSLVCLDRDLGARIFRNEGRFVFTDITAASGFAIANPKHNPGPLVALAAGDLDHDGCDDFVARPEPSYDTSNFLVWRGDCAGHFVEVTDAWGLRSTQIPNASPIGVSLVDVNGDGRLDVVGGRFAPTVDIGAVVLARSDPSGGWKLVDTSTIGLAASGYPFVVGFSDVDGSGQMDVIVLNQPRCDSDMPWGSGTVHVGKLPSQLFLARGDGTFAEKIVPGVFGDTSFCLSNSPMGLVGGDSDGDGTWELFITDFMKQRHFAIGKDLSFVDLAPSDGSELDWNVEGDPSQGYMVGWSAHFVDWGRDGNTGLFVACGKDEGNTLQPYSKLLLRSGTHLGLHPELLPGLDAHCSDGSTAADFDGDAVMDIMPDGWGESPELLWNRVGTGAALSIRLRGTTSNASGIGAKVAVTSNGKTITREIYPGSARRGWSEPRAFFGLGSNAAADQVVVTWPGGAVQTLSNVAAGRMTIIEH